MTQMISVFTVHTGVHVCVTVAQCIYVYVCPTVDFAGAGALTTTSSIFSRTSCILLLLLPLLPIDDDDSWGMT